MLAAKELSYLTPQRMLFRHVSFSLSSGQALVITGANGSGKTTLLKIIAGLLFPTTGALLWSGKAIQTIHTEFKHSLCFIGHKDALKAELTVLENIHYQSTLNGHTTSVATRDILKQLGLKQQAHLRTKYLSAGQKRRLALAKLLCSSAKLWLLDEPITSLDNKAKVLIEEMVNQHIDNQGMALITTHTPLKIDNCQSLVIGTP